MSAAQDDGTEFVYDVLLNGSADNEDTPFRHYEAAAREARSLKRSIPSADITIRVRFES